MEGDVISVNTPLSPAGLHARLIDACENGTIVDVKVWLDAGADPNFNLKGPGNALYAAIKRDNPQMMRLLLSQGAIVKEFVLQKALERDKSYLQVLVPDFRACSDESLLMGTLQAAITLSDVDLAKLAIGQGARAESLSFYAFKSLESTEILALLLENGFDIHRDANKIFSEWMGGWRDSRPTKLELLAFLSGYYLDKPDALAKFNASILQKSLLFRIGLDSNHLTLMKFAVLTGVDKNEALNAALYHYYAYKEGKSSSKIDYEIITYLLQTITTFKKVTIENAVCFEYTELLEALRGQEELAYGYEVAYRYENEALCDFFTEKGLSKEARSFAKLKVSAVKGDMQALRSAVNEGAEVRALETTMLVEVLNRNRTDVLKYLHEAGVVYANTLEPYLDAAMQQHKAYDALSYLIELGLDITRVGKIPLAYKERYPLFTDMWERRCSDLFVYTVYLATEVYPKAEGKRKEEILKNVAALSSLPYVIQKSEEQTHGH